MPNVCRGCHIPPSKFHWALAAQCLQGMPYSPVKLTDIVVNRRHDVVNRRYDLINRVNRTLANRDNGIVNRALDIVNPQHDIANCRHDSMCFGTNGAP